MICPLKFVGWHSFCTKILVKWVVMTCILVDVYNDLEEYAACAWYPPMLVQSVEEKCSLQWE